jgi:hypothetical protein
MARNDRAVQDRLLDRVFSRVGEEYGFDEVTAVYRSYNSFKITWERTTRFVMFKVSDLLRGIPEDALESLARRTLSMIRGEEADPGEKFLEYIRTDEYFDLVRPRYLKKHRAEVSEELMQLMDDYPMPYRMTIAVYDSESEEIISAPLLRCILVSSALVDPLHSDSELERTNTRYILYTHIAEKIDEVMQVLMSFNMCD